MRRGYRKLEVARATCKIRDICRDRGLSSVTGGEGTLSGPPPFVDFS